MQVSASLDFETGCQIPVAVQGRKDRFTGTLDLGSGVKALYFRFLGEGTVDFHAFLLE